MKNILKILKITSWLIVIFLGLLMILGINFSRIFWILFIILLFIVSIEIFFIIKKDDNKK